MVNSVVRPALFSEQLFLKMEPCAKQTIKKHNPELVDTVFRLTFEILWVAPYDRRRGNAVLSEFESSARQTADLLTATDLAAASAEQLQTLMRSVERLMRNFERLEAEHIFTRWQCAEALAQMRRIGDVVRKHCVCAVG